MYSEFYVEVTDSHINLYKRDFNEMSLKHSFPLNQLQGTAMQVSSKTYSIIDSVLSSLASAKKE